MLSCIIGLILSSLIIVFNEPLAKGSIMFYHKLFGTPINDRIIRRSKFSFIICGTILIWMNAMALRSILS